MPDASHLVNLGTSLVVESTKGKLLEYVTGKMMEGIRHRRISSFLEQLGNDLVLNGFQGSHSETIDEKLIAHLSNRENADAFYEIYRRVLLCASRDLGPKIVAMLAAILLKEERLARKYEEWLFDCAEKLKDSELRELSLAVREACQNQSKLLEEFEMVKSQFRSVPFEEDGFILCSGIHYELPYICTTLQNLGVALSYSAKNVDGQEHFVVFVHKSLQFLADLIDRATGPAK